MSLIVEVDGRRMIFDGKKYWDRGLKWTYPDHVTVGQCLDIGTPIRMINLDRSARGPEGVIIGYYGWKAGCVYYKVQFNGGPTYINWRHVEKVQRSKKTVAFVLMLPLWILYGIGWTIGHAWGVFCEACAIATAATVTCIGHPFMWAVDTWHDRTPETWRDFYNGVRESFK